MTDTTGNLLAVQVHAANLHDTVSGIGVARQAAEKYPRIAGFCADAGRRKTFEADAKAFGLKADISERIKPGFEILPKRWVAERTFGWMAHSRRLSKDYEIRTGSAETMVRISHLHTLLKRCA